ncbi:hypothetical protein [Pelomonas sp. SE-A7]|uniref:hypothetical protein n=1 Tax=Pelomonas sp. SE-A7 TaxID=3054953 RepID=UPI00259C8F86|nr:hypothetical protein [Pelomonas sp. SE-A7]MDM4766164.1 hypothetical protein [Pelomonas sp. SE-A7]
MGYQLACTSDSDVLVRLVSNTGSGYFSREWVRFASILELLPPDQPLTFSALQPLFEGRSVNTGGFLMAVLKGLSVIRSMEENPRAHELGELSGFVAEVQALMASPVSLGEDARPDGGKAGGKSKRKTRGAP